jgi:hypothetical protein
MLRLQPLGTSKQSLGFTISPVKAFYFALRLCGLYGMANRHHGVEAPCSQVADKGRGAVGAKLLCIPSKLEAPVG